MRIPCVQRERGRLADQSRACFQSACSPHGSRAAISHPGPACACSSGAQGYCAQLTTRMQHADELSTVPMTVELEEGWSAAAGRQPLRHAVRVTWHGEHGSGDGLRMEGESMGRVPRVDPISRSCSPSDLRRFTGRDVVSARIYYAMNTHVPPVRERERVVRPGLFG